MTDASLSKSHCPTRVEFGRQAWTRVAEIVQKNNWSKVLLLTDPGLKGSRLHRSLVCSLKNLGIELEEFDGINPEPTDKNVVSALRVSSALSPQVLVVLGGGSAIDVAKAVAIVATNGGEISDYEGIDTFDVPPLPLIAIPTTAGTGSEVSGAAVITDTLRNSKMAIRHAHYGPATYAILDPEAISTTPQHVAIHSGIDAFVHAFESYLSKLANPFTDAQNLHAIRLISDNLRPYVANRENQDAAFNMLCASSMAAMSFGTTGTGNVHCMAMALGSKYPIPHGLANAVCLPHVAEFNFIATPQRFAILAATMGIDTRGLSTLDAGRKAITAIKELCDDLNVPPRLRDVGVEEKDLPEISEKCFLLDYNRWNPRWTTEKDFLTLLQKAY
ncbi:iron-containing alcohol dehydrogenase [Halomonas sp. GD1P12]|uniref:iron-containing alcohol dehydrogenase n=1 Tax=Halomonas sp. GD1P12 TaxID=2982691 RepID=UPI0021E4D29C|nr:iron-containing alcohol dehydrogenase [Halomonas sp. GD1P12]UYG00663.1 iron-containing alcohol dehydrogenase [Halomonas sp. GD1P12]